MKVHINGVEHDVPEPSSVADLVTIAAASPSGIAVALDGAVVPRSSWATAVTPGAVVEIVTAVQGG